MILSKPPKRLKKNGFDGNEYVRFPVCPGVISNRVVSPDKVIINLYKNGKGAIHFGEPEIRTCNA